MIGKQDAMRLFRDYMKVTGVSRLDYEETENKALYGKCLGIINGSSWVTLWSNYYGKLLLPGVKLVNIGNEAIQLNFMLANRENRQCPPQENIDLYCGYARDLCRLCRPDAILLTCSTMGRSYPSVERAAAEYGVPVVQIDQPMMQKAVDVGNNILIIATHGPTVDSTRLMLEETAAASGKAHSIRYEGCIIEEAFDLLGEGRLEDHNRLIENEIRKAVQNKRVDCVVLAQLSMSIFKIEHPNAEQTFGVPVLCSGEEGFLRIRELLERQTREEGESH